MDIFFSFSFKMVPPYRLCNCIFTFDTSTLCPKKTIGYRIVDFWRKYLNSSSFDLSCRRDFKTCSEHILLFQEVVKPDFWLLVFALISLLCRILEVTVCSFWFSRNAHWHQLYGNDKFDHFARTSHVQISTVRCVRTNYVLRALFLWL